MTSGPEKTATCTGPSPSATVTSQDSDSDHDDCGEVEETVPEGSPGTRSQDKHLSHAD